MLRIAISVRREHATAALQTENAFANGRLLATFWSVISLNSAMDELACWGELLDQVEFVAVRGQYWDARLRGRQEYQRVVQAFLALIRLETLRARQRARDHPGIRPDPSVRRHQPGRG